MIRPGPRNTITDVPGLSVGNAEAEAFATGVTVVLPEAPAMAAASVTGGAPGTRATTILGPGAVMTEIHAIALSGGSAYGLDAAGGAMAALGARGLGFAMGPVRVPIVPGAIIFDLLLGPPADLTAPPWWELGRRAVETAGAAFALGNAGAGLGAKAGRIKGGLGSASITTGAFTIGALAVVNALGSVLVPGSRAFWAAPFEQHGEFGAVPMPPAPLADPDFDFSAFRAGTNTTLAVIATDATLDRAQAERVATMAQDGLARAIRPAHSPLDGDTVFALSTARVGLGDPIADTARIGHLAADCLARAIARGVYEAESLADLPSYRDLPEPPSDRPAEADS